MIEFRKLPNRIVLHCSDGTDLPERIDRDIIRDWHRAQGWDDIGYHYVIEEINGSGHVLLPGRSPRYEGAHCKAQGANRYSYGVCVVGKFDAAPVPPKVYAAVMDALTLLCIVHRVPPSGVLFHRDLEPGKTCPGLAWDRVRVATDLVRRLGLAGDGPGPYINLSTS